MCGELKVISGSPGLVIDLVEVIRDAWGWIGIDPVEILGESDFGNLIIRSAEGRYWRLVPEDCECEVIATTRAELDELSRDQEFLRDWLCMRNQWRR